MPRILMPKPKAALTERLDGRGVDQRVAPWEVARPELVNEHQNDVKWGFHWIEIYNFLSLNFFLSQNFKLRSMCTTRGPILRLGSASGKAV